MLNVFSSILRTYEMDNSARVILTKVWCLGVGCSDRNQKEEYRNTERKIKRLSTRDIGQSAERNRDITASVERGQNRSAARILRQEPSFVFRISRSGLGARRSYWKGSQRENKRNTVSGSGRKDTGEREQNAKPREREREISRFNISRTSWRASGYKEPRISASAMSHLGVAIANAGDEGERELTPASSSRSREEEGRKEGWCR